MVVSKPSTPAGAHILNEPRPGEVLDGRFKLLQTINRGGMAYIYEALDRKSGRSVAVKVPLTHCESDPGFYSRFQREEAIGLTLDHPYVVKFIPCGRDKSRPYIVMEYLEGQTLAHRLGEAPQMPEFEAARIASQTCEALNYLHRNGIVHRDLKPENVMLCNDGSIRVMDFGIAKSETARRLTFGGFTSAVGTPDYISPEQVQGKRGDARTDIYSLGTMLYVMTTGSAPYPGDNPFVVMNARLNGDPEAPRAKNPQISPQMEEIILHAMEREPSHRFTSAMTMKALLDDYAKVTVTPRARKMRKPGFMDAYKPILRIMALIVVAQAVVFCLLLWYFSHKHHGSSNSNSPPPAGMLPSH